MPDTLTVNVLEVSNPEALLMFNTNENVPACVGVPVIAPAGSNPNPGGSPDVDETDHVTGPVESNATSAYE